MCEYYLCGPIDMHHDLREALIAWGVDEQDMHWETFPPRLAVRSTLWLRLRWSSRCQTGSFIGAATTNKCC